MWQLVKLVNIKEETTLNSMACASPNEHGEESNADIPLLDTNTTTDIDECLCSICFDYFIQPVRVLPCGHKFCKYCIDRWMSMSIRRPCPTCRQQICVSRQLPELENFMNMILPAKLTPDEIAQRAATINQRQLQEDSDNGPATSQASILSNPNSTTIASSQQPLSPYLPASPILIRIRDLSTSADDDQWPSVLRPPRSEVFNSDRSYPRQRQRYFNDERMRQDIDMSNNILLPPSRNEPFPSHYDQLREHYLQILEDEEVNEDLIEEHINQQSAVSRNVSSICNQIIIEYRFHLNQVEQAYRQLEDTHREFQYHNNRLSTLFDEFTEIEAQYWDVIPQQIPTRLQESTRSRSPSAYSGPFSSSSSGQIGPSRVPLNCQTTGNRAHVINNSPNQIITDRRQLLVEQFAERVVQEAFSPFRDYRENLTTARQRMTSLNNRCRSTRSIFTNHNIQTSFAPNNADSSTPRRRESMQNLNPDDFGIPRGLLPRSMLRNLQRRTQLANLANQNTTTSRNTENVNSEAQQQFRNFLTDNEPSINTTHSAAPEQANETDTEV